VYRDSVTAQRYGRSVSDADIAAKKLSLSAANDIGAALSYVIIVVTCCNVAASCRTMWHRCVWKVLMCGASVMTENDAEEQFYSVYSSIRSVISTAVSVPNSSSLNVVHNFI